MKFKYLMSSTGNMDVDVTPFPWSLKIMFTLLSYKYTKSHGVFSDIYRIKAVMKVRVRVMVFNATFNNISAILWRSVLLVEEIGVPGENNRPVTGYLQTLSHSVVSSTLLHEWDSNLQR